MTQPDTEAAPARPAARRGGGILRRFRRDRGGATAVEFAFVSVPFFAILFAIIETALVFWTNQVLETAVSNASRRIYTGQFQAANPGATGAALRDAFRAEVCSNLVALVSCDALHVGVQSFATFADARVQSPVRPDGTIDLASFTVQPTQARDIVVVRAAVEFPVILSFLDGGALSNGRRLLLATAAFRNEPF